MLKITVRSGKGYKSYIACGEQARDRMIETHDIHMVSKIEEDYYSLGVENE